MYVLGVVIAITCLGYLLPYNAWAVDPLHEDSLENVLREKGVISKEDWVRIEAAQEKEAQALSSRMDQEFPIGIGYGRKGF